MDDLTAVRTQAQELTEHLSTGWLDDARSFFTGFLFTVAMTALGAALVTVALVVGVVGAPVIAAVVAYVMFRSRRAARMRVLAT